MKDFAIPSENWFHQVIAGEHVTNVYVGSKRKDPFCPICALKQDNFEYRISYDCETSSFTLEFSHRISPLNLVRNYHRIDLLQYDSLLPLLRGYYGEFVKKECL